MKPRKYGVTIPMTDTERELAHTEANEFKHEWAKAQAALAKPRERE